MTRVTLRSMQRPTDLGHGEGSGGGGGGGGGGSLTADDGDVWRWVAAKPAAITAAAIATESGTAIRLRRDTGPPMGQRLLESSLTRPCGRHYSVSVRTAVPPEPEGKIWTVLMLTISRSPYRLSSRPMPLCFTPPNGMRGSDFTVPFTNTMPDSMRAAISSARARFLVQTLAPSPNSESFASRIAASMPATATTGATGPNVSSRRTRMSFVTRVS